MRFTPPSWYSVSKRKLFGPTPSSHADQGPGDVVEECGKNEHKGQKDETTGPIVRQRGRHPVGNAARLEMACKQSEANQKQKQIRQENPFMGEMGE